MGFEKVKNHGIGWQSWLCLQTLIKKLFDSSRVKPNNFCAYTALAAKKSISESQTCAGWFDSKHGKSHVEQPLRRACLCRMPLAPSAFRLQDAFGSFTFRLQDALSSFCRMPLAPFFQDALVSFLRGKFWDLYSRTPIVLLAVSWLLVWTCGEQSWSRLKRLWFSLFWLRFQCLLWWKEGVNSYLYLSWSCLSQEDMRGIGNQAAS